MLETIPSKIYSRLFLRPVSECGRTMTEMIGVLVIIGILSLGFIWGFPWAMDKYRAIKTIEDVRTRAVECSSQLINRNLCDLGDFDTMTSQGYNWILGIDPNDVSTFDITVQKVPMGVCKKIATTGWAVPRIFIGNIGPITSANCAEENDMTFVFSKDLSELSASEGGDCPPGVETVCPEGFGKGCSGPRASGYCGCRKCYPCEGYTGSGYLTTCDTGRSCKSGGCVCTAGGCPAGQSNFCPEGSSWVAGGVDNCGDQCYVCQSSTPGECVPSCPTGSGVDCHGALVAGGSCGATCRTCLSCEGFVGTEYRQTCPAGSQCSTDGCVCSTGGCPAGETLKCDTGHSWVKGGKDACGNQCYTCESAPDCNCQNGGRCENGVCQCANGWTGEKCTECSGVQNLLGYCCQSGTTVCYDECCGEGMRCDDTLKRCAQTKCPDGQSILADGTCSGNLCGDNTHCKEGFACYQGRCVTTVCRQDSDCTDPEKPICRVFSNPANNECVPACKTPTTTKENCPCNTDKDCLDASGNPLTGNAKYCFFSEKRCCECRADSECESGYCKGCMCDEVRACFVGMPKDQCLRCSRSWDEFEWTGTACCPTASNTLNPYSRLTGDNCVVCGGIVNDKNECVKFECPSDISAITDQTSCQRCNGVWNCQTVGEEQICSCGIGECSTNADCGPDQYCGGSTGSCYYPNYNRCVNASYSRLTIQHNGQTESWYIFNNAMSWWDALNACKSIGKSLQPKEVVLERWKKLGSFWWTRWAWTSSGYTACNAILVELSTGKLGSFGRFGNGDSLVLCR